MAVVGEDFLPSGSVSTRLQGDSRTLGGRSVPPGPTRKEDASSKELEDGRVGHCPYSQDSWWLGSPPMQDLPSPGPQCTGSQGLQIVLGPGREGGPGGPWHSPCTAPSPICPAPSPPHALSHPFHHCCLGSKWFPPWPRPRQSGPGPDHPHRSPRPESPCSSCCGVCPRLLSACPRGRLAPLCPLCTPQPSPLVSN